MRDAADDVLDLRAPDPRGLNRVMTLSLAVHVGVVMTLVLVPRHWLFDERVPPKLMTISLGGSAGPRSTGMTPIGGRPVEQVAPEPKRPEPIRPAAPKSDVLTLSAKPTSKPPPAKPVPTPLAPVVVPKPPTTGKEVTQGSARAETGAKGQATGLTIGGGGGAEATLDVPPDFCCMEYVKQVLGIISSNWRKDLPDRGTTTIVFTIRRDGTVADVQVEQSSGSGLLDRSALSAMELLQKGKMPLPTEYTGDKLTIHLKFPYGSTR
jgi:protein TonB